MIKLKYLAAALMGLALTGCVSFTPSGPIGLPAQVLEHSVPAGAMLKEVEVSDTRLNETQRRNISNTLTAQIAQHIERGEYFERMISFPATLGEQDVQLQFNFTSLKGKRTPHPGYFPGALLTLTVWIWVNGPIYVDKYDLAAELEVVDAAGKQVALSQKTLARNQNTGLWDYDYFNTSLGSRQLTELVEQLLHDATQQLAH
ncbi:hypothetical protein GYM54_20335 [Pseudomonas sp. MTM4]|uniref:hypothetical protein n=1 Tax=unclassified Pseudomonas TaxID=196821 RepID=UPI0018D20F56|nr:MULTISPECIES: hypothetical protein [unclassified Pseudomonas]MBC8650169.1 hypothetical protein [Pseudomonas sp. MT4]QXY93791.1 hypothetical protein GYM54_20335 [Pseudomonas sp. MTM4]